MRIIGGILLVLLLFATLVFLMGSVVSVGIQFFEPIAKLNIWNNPLWMRIRIPAIAGVVVLGVALLIFVSSRRDSKAEAALKAFAFSRGWGYVTSSDDPEGVVARVAGALEKISFDKKFDVQTVITVNEVGRSIALFSCRFRERNSTETATYGSVCLVQSEKFPISGLQTNILARGPIDSALLPEQVDLGDSEFTRSFIVQSKDPATARRTATDALQAALLSQWNDPVQRLNGMVEIIVGPGGALVLRFAEVKADEWLAMLELARRIESSM